MRPNASPTDDDGLLESTFFGVFGASSSSFDDDDDIETRRRVFLSREGRRQRERTTMNGEDFPYIETPIISLDKTFNFVHHTTTTTPTTNDSLALAR